jgi:hypothetical protein
VRGVMVGRDDRTRVRPLVWQEATEAWTPTLLRNGIWTIW